MQREQRTDLTELLLGLVPANGAAIGNPTLREKFMNLATKASLAATDADFDHLRETLIVEGILAAVRKRMKAEVHGFDYFDTAKGEPVSGGKGKIAVKIVDDRGVESLKVIGLG